MTQSTPDCHPTAGKNAFGAAVDQTPLFEVKRETCRHGGPQAVRTFRRILSQQRSRADSQEQPCSLLLFTTDNGRMSRAEARQFANLVSGQLRPEDTLAWVTSDILGVIPRGMDAIAARQLAQSICKVSTVDWETPLVSRVYSYPGQWFYDGHRRSHEPADSVTRASNKSPTNGRPQKRKRKQRDVSRQYTSAPCLSDNSSPSTPRLQTESVARSLLRPLPPSKRVLDIVVSCVALIALTPLLLAVAVWIKLSSRGPVLFRQVRWGFLGSPFVILKFRTMRRDVDTDSHRRYVENLLHAATPMSKLDLTSKLIPLGGFLRKSAIDELPQLINVLRGEMSLVGPRPDVIPFSAYCPRDVRRFDAVPGITGLWQVSGKNRTTFREMIQFDAFYAEHRSFWLDLKILFKTLPTLALHVRDSD